MTDEHQEHGVGPEPTPADTAAGHELSDASIPALVTFLAGLLVSLAVVIFAVAWMFDWLANRAERRDPPEAPLADLRPDKPPSPRLQQSPALDMRTLRAQQEQKLNHPEWLDKQSGVVRMPIERAMKLVAKPPRDDETNGDLPRTNQTEQGFPKWPHVEVKKVSDEDVEQKRKTEPPGTGENPDAKSRKSVPEKQPSDVLPKGTAAGNNREKK